MDKFLRQKAWNMVQITERQKRVSQKSGEKMSVKYFSWKFIQKGGMGWSDILCHVALAAPPVKIVNIIIVSNYPKWRPK